MCLVGRAIALAADMADIQGAFQNEIAIATGKRNTGKIKIGIFLDANSLLRMPIFMYDLFCCFMDYLSVDKCKSHFSSNTGLPQLLFLLVSVISNPAFL